MRDIEAILLYSDLEFVAIKINTSNDICAALGGTKDLRVFGKREKSPPSETLICNSLRQNNPSEWAFFLTSLPIGMLKFKCSSGICLV